MSVYVRLMGGETEIEQKAKASTDRPVLAATRRARIAELLRGARSVTVAQLEGEFGISSMTARRDLAELERQGLARRTYGGAVLPDIAAHEDSFTQRLETAPKAKQALADAAVARITPGETVLLDSSTTSYFVARRIVDHGSRLTVITNSLPVMDLIATSAAPSIDLIGAGGSLRPLTRSFVGPVAVAAVRAHFADRLFLSVKGLTTDGSLTDADPLEAEVKRAMIEQAGEATLLIDASKLAVRGLSTIAHVRELAGVLGYGVDAAGVDRLRSVGAQLALTGGDAARSEGHEASR
jgi:DeoR/GlpR family transcriptional regulator of sugar metabolism